MNIYKPILVIFILILSGFSAVAQNHWQARFRPGVHFPIGQYQGNEVNTGFGFEVNLAYIVLPYVSAYGGWEWRLFKTADFEEAGAVDLEETGYSLGLRFIHPLKGQVSYLIGGGAVYKHLEIEQQDNTRVGDSGHKLGWQAEAGFSIHLGNAFYLQPGLHYQSVSLEDKFNYFSLGMALSKTF
ncbi:outer membrane beta-barrel protein [Salegentibacter chungangensis]|uniref:Outer membrane beta-barrel protein n=1 Tax=Salegentibacter chungangensis TaxID=1335724 RepID=A0ABW3NNY5_9FLAO